MLKSVLFRENNVYKAFPDFVEYEEGWLVCVYRESLGHAALPFGRIACRISRDGGRNWSEKIVVDEITEPETQGRLNNPRLLSLDNSEIMLICDLLPLIEPEQHLPVENFTAKV